MDDGVADDAGGDGEYWEEHGKSPLLRFCFARDFPGHTAICKTRAKRKNAFSGKKNAGWRIRAICVDGYIYKIVSRNTFSYAIQNTKDPAEAEPKKSSAKTQTAVE